MSGDLCQSILDNHTKIFEGIYTKNEAHVWEAWRILFEFFINAPESSILKAIDNLMSISFFEIGSHYLHIMIQHLPEILLEHKSLTRFANQGTEKRLKGRMYLNVVR
ncbi:hypothetical protein PROFUN_15647 [Planoprotostelium fungivorum]|uniref:Uncharacterized protein n=1 Tax=Planoprotostelium fungivorum TaxID=1890364 RepID=A0A2P6MV60_9EUKA|nr:hypothetical protein PROFUN_15647 [Planoprotostelium fungivorum]